MFKKEKRFAQPYPGMGPQPYPSGYPEQSGTGMYPQLQTERLQQEIMENRRRINNLARRVSRIENYLRIHETPDGGYYDEEPPQNYSF